MAEFWLRDKGGVFAKVTAPSRDQPITKVEGVNGQRPPRTFKDEPMTVDLLAKVTGHGGIGEGGGYVVEVLESNPEEAS